MTSHLEPSPAREPHDVTVHTIVEMTRAFPGMDQASAARLLSEADKAQHDGLWAAATLGVFVAEARDPMTNAVLAAARYKVVKVAHRVYDVRVEAVDEE
jgi:hypothetical protein